MCIVVVAVAAGVAAYEGYQAYRHEQQMEQNARAANVDLEIANQVARDPNGRATSQVDLNALQKDYSQARSETYVEGYQAASSANTAVNNAMLAASTSITGGPNPSSPTPDINRAVGGGIKAGKSVISQVVKSSQADSSQASKPGLLQRIINFISPAPQPPPPPPTPPAAPASGRRAPLT